MPTTRHGSSPVAGTSADRSVSYLEWGAVLGGAVIASAISIVLLQFAAGVGMALGSPTLEDGSPSWNVLVAGLWVALVALASATTGGYVTGRMRCRWGDALEEEVEIRDGMHGLAVWAVATLVAGVTMAMLATLAAVGTEAAAVTAESLPPTDVARLTANVETIFAFASGAGAALGAGAAWYAAIAGGNHRDEGLALHDVARRLFRRAPPVTRVP